MKRAALLFLLLLSGTLYGQSTDAIGNFPFNFPSPAPTTSKALMWDPAATNALGGTGAVVFGTPSAGTGIGTDPFWAAKGDLAVATGNDAASVLTVGTANQVLTVDSSTATGLKWATPGGGSGTVTSFSAGDLSPIFTTTEATITSTPALSFSLSTAAAHTFLGNNTGSTVAPAYVAVADADLSTTDITTNNASNAKHGFLPKTPNDATKYLNGGGTPTFTAVNGSDLTMSDVTTNNVTTTAHGFAPKGDGDTAHFLNGNGAYSTPAGGGTVTNTGTLTSNAVVLGNGTTDTKVVTGITTDGTSKITLGVAGTSVGKIDFKNATTGTVTLQPVTGALGSVVASLPALTGVVLLDTAVQTISNHTIDSSNAIAAAAITSGNVGAANGGTGINSSASNGFATVASGTWSVSKSVPSGTVIGATDTQTMTNKRIQPRVSTSATGNTTPTPNADTDDVYVATGMTVNMVFGAPTNTATDGQRLLIRIKGTAARTLGWNAIYRASTDLALPTTTITTKTMYLGFVYNSADTTWDLVAYLDNF